MKDILLDLLWVVLAIVTIPIQIVLMSVLCIGTSIWCSTETLVHDIIILVKE